MDRHFLAVLLVALLAALGCSSKDSGSQPASAVTPAVAEMPVEDRALPTVTDPTVAETHRPIIVGSEPLNPREPLETVSPFPPGIASSPSQQSFENPADPPPLPAAPRPQDMNPLRPDLAPSAADFNAKNPLRRSRAAPRMAAPPELPTAAEPTPPPATAFAPAGGAAPSSEPFVPGSSGSAPAPVQVPAAPPAAAFPTAPLAMDLGGLGGDAPLPIAAIPSGEPYDVVEVFYGTDRLASELLVDTLPARFLRFLPTGCSVLVTLCLAVIAASRRGFGMWLMALGGLGVTLGLGLQAATTTIAAVRQADKDGIRYTAERSQRGQIDLGLCAVTIPKMHAIGELESPSILRLEIREDASRHVVLSKTERLASEPFYTLLRERVQASPRRELFIFVHGFNVTFEDAARRTAQIHHDLKFSGAPVFFSWPAHDKFVVTYPADENNVAWSTPHLKQFLLEVVQESQAESVNLVAHSMGNRALTAALREIELELKDNSRLFNQVILAAPDIDADDFRHNIAPALQRTAKRLTLYASSRDDALFASRLLHRGPRAGDAGEGLVVVNGIDTIDVTAIDSSPWGHSYYGSSDPVLNDLKAMLMLATPPHERSWLSAAERHGLKYWIFQPARTATADGTPSR